MIGLRSLQRLETMVRHVTGDVRVRVRWGVHSAYMPTEHVIEFEEAIREWPDAEQLALACHESTHVVLSRYLDHARAPTWSPLDRHLLNWLEDARIHTWIRGHFPGLGAGIDGLEDRVFGGERQRLERGLPLSDAPLPPVLRFAIALRADATGRARQPDGDPAVEDAVRAGLAAASAAVHSVPEAWRPDEAEKQRCSDQFVERVDREILPLLRRFAPPASDEPRAREVLRRAGEGASEAWRSVWRELGRRPDATAAASASPRRPPRPSGDLEAVRREVAPRIARLARELEETLAPNARGGWTSGWSTGPKLDLRAVRRAETHHEAPTHVWLRRPPESEVRWRLCLLLDLSGSMAGPRIASLQRASVALLEAAERVEIPTLVLTFGVEGAGVAVAKPFLVPLATARGDVQRALFETPLGSETPLALALDQARLLLTDRRHPDERDLVVVVTDGAPAWSEEAFFATPRVVNSRSDAGSVGAPLLVQGAVRIWRAGDACKVDTERAARRLVAESGAILVGVGIGTEAELGAFFQDTVTFADDGAFFEGFFTWFRRLSGQLVGGRDGRDGRDGPG